MTASGGVATRSYATAAARGSGPVLALLLCVLGVLPLLAAFPAPLQDWPNHVARIHVELGLLRGDPFWSRYYKLGTFLVPDAALDVSLLGLVWCGLSVQAAAAAFLCATYAVFVSGILLLSRALHAAGPEKPALAVLLFYGAALFWGLAGYVLGVGLLLLLLAAWVRLEVRAGWRTLLAAAGAVLLALVHPVPAVVWPALLACFDLPRALRGARWGALSWLAAGVVVIAMLRVLPSETGRDLSLGYAGGGTALGFLHWKLHVFATVLLGGARWQDRASTVALLYCVAAPACGARLRAAWPAALAVAVAVALVVLAPERLGTGSLLDVRLAILPLLLLACSVRVAWRSARARRLGVALMVAVVLGRTAVIGAAWHEAGAVFGAFRAASASLPSGSLMMMAYGTPLHSLSRQDIWSPPIQSIATQVVFRNVFFPALFANPAQQPIVLRPDYRAIAQPWNLTDEVHLAAAAQQIAPLCAGRVAGVYLTVLYAGAVATEADRAVLHAQKDFVVLDACRLVRR